MSPPPPASTIHLHDPSPTAPGKRTYLIFFITGNPGLIEYYRTFFTHLYGLLTSSSTSSSPAFEIFGRSLSGFEIPDPGPKSEDETIQRGHPPYSLQEQISHAQEELERVVSEVKRRNGGNQDVRVILMGHSVGSYILLEVARRVRVKALAEKERKRDGKVQDESVRIAAGICLFPTVTHIARSASGRKATPLFNLPAFPLLASLFAKFLTLFLPLPLLTSLIQQLMHFPPSGAHTTASFVRSPTGVHQALHMARDEMREITHDAWDEEIWGAVGASEHAHPRPILRFLFAQKDHWVADETRDELIRVRARGGGEEGEKWKPVMEVDVEEGWVHGFCIKQSVGVAERIGRWVREIVEEDAKR